MAKYNVHLAFFERPTNSERAIALNLRLYAALILHRTVLDTTKENSWCFDVRNDCGKDRKFCTRDISTTALLAKMSLGSVNSKSNLESLLKDIHINQASMDLKARDWLLKALSVLCTSCWLFPVLILLLAIYDRCCSRVR